MVLIYISRRNGEATFNMHMNKKKVLRIAVSQSSWCYRHICEWMIFIKIIDNLDNISCKVIKYRYEISQKWEISMEIKIWKGLLSKKHNIVDLAESARLYKMPKITICGKCNDVIITVDPWKTKHHVNSKLWMDFMMLYFNV